VYLASTHWRGSLNVGDMRMFKTLDDAVTYLSQSPRIGIPPRVVPVAEWFFFRIYFFDGFGVKPCLVRKQAVLDVAKRLGIP